MAKTSSKSEVFITLENNLLRGLSRFKGQDDASEQSKLRVARGNTLNRISKIIQQVAGQGYPWQILAVERHCEQFFLASFADSIKAQQASIQALQTISRLQSTIAAPLSPEQYRNNLLESVGAQNMDKLPAIPKDDFHLFVRSQAQRLAKAPGQMATPPEEWYFRTRKEALYTALKLHEKNCENALGIIRSEDEQDIER